MAQTVKELLETIQRDMFERAKAHRDSHISDAHDYAEFKRAVENKPGFIRGTWCGDQGRETRSKKRQQQLPVVCRLKIRSISQIPVSAVENRHTNWYTGEKHIKICKMLCNVIERNRMRIQLPVKVDNIIKTLEAAGYEAFAVGGCIRDSVLGRTQQDWDITTSAKKYGM